MFALTARLRGIPVRFSENNTDGVLSVTCRFICGGFIVSFFIIDFLPGEACKICGNLCKTLPTTDINNS